MKLFSVLALSLAAIGLAACETPSEHITADFGNAVRHNMAAQIINPEGSRVDEVPAQDGERVLRAHDRLVTEEKAAPALRTTTTTAPGIM